MAASFEDLVVRRFGLMTMQSIEAEEKMLAMAAEIERLQPKPPEAPKLTEEELAAARAEALARVKDRAEKRSQTDYGSVL